MQEKTIRIIALDTGRATGITSVVYELTQSAIVPRYEDHLFIEAGVYKDVGNLERHLYQAVEVMPKVAKFSGKAIHSHIDVDYTMLIVESPFALKKNLNSVLTQQGFLSALIMGFVYHAVYTGPVSFPLPLVKLIKPALVKKLASANTEHPFTSGNGLMKKPPLAEIIADKFSLTPEQLQTMTTKPNSRSQKPVYEITDSLAVGYAGARILQAAYFDLDQDIPKRKNTESLRGIISNWKTLI